MVKRLGVFLSSFYILVPLGQQFGHVRWQVCGEVHFLAGLGMLEAQGTGMQSLARTNGKTVAYEAVVGAALCAAEYLVAPIAFVVEEWMADMLHVYPDLMGSPCFKYAFHQSDIAIAFQHPVVCHSMLAYSRLGVKYSHLHAVSWIACNVAFYTSFVVKQVAPYERIIASAGGLVEKLYTKL